MSFADVSDFVLWSVFRLDPFGWHKDESRAYWTRLAQERALRCAQQQSTKHLRAFYSANKALLGDAYPAESLDAFIHAEITNATDPSLPWTLCHKKITELQPLIAHGRDRQRQELARQTSRNLRVQMINDQIASCERQINNLQDSDLADAMQDEITGLRDQTRNLQLQRDQLLAGSD